MNLLHLKYAVEVEKTQSFTKAANNLFMNQPHLSKSIKELEDTLGIMIFNRTSKGVFPTKKGTEFLSYAKKVLAQIEEMETLYQTDNQEKLSFDISVPRASYISYAFTEFIKNIDFKKEIKINYKETNSIVAVKNVYTDENNLGIIRYPTIYEQYFMNFLEEKELKYKPIWEFEYLTLMSKYHPLAKENEIDFSKLKKYTEITHGDITIPFLPLSKINKIKNSKEIKKEIAVYERGSQFEILSRIPTTFMWVSPMPKKVLSCFSLVQKKCKISKNKHKDILIYRNGYHFSNEDKAFIDQLHRTIKIVSQF